MTFSTIVILLNDMARTAAMILNETSLGTVKISGPGINSLSQVCVTLTELDGQINGPDVPCHIKINLPFYEASVIELRQHLADLIEANIDAFSKAAQEILKADVARQARLMTDRKTR